MLFILKQASALTFGCGKVKTYDPPHNIAIYDYWKFMVFDNYHIY